MHYYIFSAKLLIGVFYQPYHKSSFPNLEYTLLKTKKEKGKEELYDSESATSIVCTDTDAYRHSKVTKIWLNLSLYLSL